MVCRVDPGTSAQYQGLQEGDRILGVNDRVVECEDYAVVRLGAGGLPVESKDAPQHLGERGARGAPPWL